MRSARRSAEETAAAAVAVAGSGGAGDEGCDAERRFEVGRRAENRDWKPGRRPVAVWGGWGGWVVGVGGIPLVEEGREGGVVVVVVMLEVEVLSWRSSSS